jgi:hypothetical protein
MLVPSQSESAVEMVTIEPLDLGVALERDAASHPANELNELGERSLAKDRVCS